jgi:hypothetical protein
MAELHERRLRFSLFLDMTADLPSERALGSDREATSRRFAQHGPFGRYRLGRMHHEVDVYARRRRSELHAVPLDLGDEAAPRRHG